MSWRVFVYLVILFSVWAEFMRHQGSHKASVQRDMLSGTRDRVGLMGVLLLVYQSVGTLVGIALLIFYGYTSVWYAPILIVIGAVISGPLFKIIEYGIGIMPKKAWLISLSGFIAIPVALVWAFGLIYAGAA